VTERASCVRDLAGVRESMISIAMVRQDAVATLRGEIDLAAVARMAPALNSLVRSLPHRVILDLTDVSFIDSRGLAMIVHLLHRVESKGGRLVVVCPPGAARQAIELAGVDRLLAFGASVEAVLDRPEHV
jgi:anti-sigma B factor antagonist